MDTLVEFGREAEPAEESRMRVEQRTMKARQKPRSFETDFIFAWAMTSGFLMAALVGLRLVSGGHSRHVAWASILPTALVMGACLVSGKLGGDSAPMAKKLAAGRFALCMAASSVLGIIGLLLLKRCGVAIPAAIGFGMVMVSLHSWMLGSFYGWAVRATKEGRTALLTSTIWLTMLVIGLVVYIVRWALR